MGVKSHLVCCVATVSTAVTHNYIVGLYLELVAQELRSVNYKLLVQIEEERKILHCMVLINGTKKISMLIGQPEETKVSSLI